MNNWKSLLGLAFCMAITGVLNGQSKLSSSDRITMQSQEKELKKHAMNVIQGINSKDRFLADSNLTRGLVKALKTKHSFYYSFDSLITVSQLFAPDSSFKIFTWQLTINDNVVRQHGAIQMNTYDGSLLLFPLIDKSELMINPYDTVTSHKAWFGALYYKIIQKQSGIQKFYTLIGFDGSNIKSSKKVIDVLTFSNEQPVFGCRNISYENDKPFKSAQSRYIMEFKKDASPKLNYDEELDIIMVEHLISEENQPAKKYTLVGDGDYEGFKWQNGKWVHVDKIFNQKLDSAPIPNGQFGEVVPTPLDKPKTPVAKPKKKGKG